jgi:ABC-type antimicrobial peptide transport system permease subunit
VRSRVEATALTAAVQREVLQLDRNIPLTAVQTMEERVADVTSRSRFIAVLLGLFAGLALLLAGIGIYGVLAYTVSARTREIGVRMALGAQSGDVLKLILAEGLKLSFIGVVVGLAAALALTRWMESLLFGVRPTDPVTFSLIAVVLLCVTLVACWIPSRRATKVDPLIALKCE